MWSGNLRKDLVNRNKEAPGDEIPGLLRCGLAGGNRTHNLPPSHGAALSIELQPDTCGD